MPGCQGPGPQHCLVDPLQSLFPQPLLLSVAPFPSPPPSLRLVYQPAHTPALERTMLYLTADRFAVCEYSFSIGARPADTFFVRSRALWHHRVSLLRDILSYSAFLTFLTIDSIVTSGTLSVLQPRSPTALSPSPRTPRTSRPKMLPLSYQPLMLARNSRRPLTLG